MHRPQATQIVNHPPARECNYIIPADAYTPYKPKADNPPNRYSEPKTVFTFNKKGQAVDEIDDNKSISSIAKQESSFSKDYFQVDFFENGGKQVDPAKTKNSKKSQASRKEGAMLVGPINTADVNFHMSGERSSKGSNFHKPLKRQSEPA
jgi:hypothetical protein